MTCSFKCLNKIDLPANNINDERRAFFPTKGIRNTLIPFRQQTHNIVRHCRRLIFRPEFKWVGHGERSKNTYRM